MSGESKAEPKGRTFRPRDYTKRAAELDGWPIGVTSYWIEQRCVVLVDNVDPGATIARAEGDSLEATERAALEIARRRLSGTARRREALRDLHESVASMEEAVRSRR